MQHSVHTRHNSGIDCRGNSILSDTIVVHVTSEWTPLSQTEPVWLTTLAPDTIFWHREMGVRKCPRDHAVTPQFSLLASTRYTFISSWTIILKLRQERAQLSGFWTPHHQSDSLCRQCEQISTFILQLTSHFTDVEKLFDQNVPRRISWTNDA
jgi:hypothetical protein